MPKLIIDGLLILRSSRDDPARGTLVIVTTETPHVPAIATQRIDFNGHPCQP